MLTTVFAVVALFILLIVVGHALVKRLRRLVVAQWIDGEGRQALADNTLLVSAHAEAHAKGFGHAFEDEMEQLKIENGRLIRIGHVISAYRNARHQSAVARARAQL